MRIRQKIRQKTSRGRPGFCRWRCQEPGLDKLIIQIEYKPIDIKEEGDHTQLRIHQKLPTVLAQIEDHLDDADAALREWEAHINTHARRAGFSARPRR